MIKSRMTALDVFFDPDLISNEFTNPFADIFAFGLGTVENHPVANSSQFFSILDSNIASFNIAGKSSILGSNLRALASSYLPFSGALNPSAYDATLRAQFPDLVINNGHVVIDIGSENPAETLNALNALGLKNGATLGNIVSGLLPIEAISALEGLEGVRFAHASQVLTNVGSVTNQADPALLADEVRSQYLVDGDGVRIGVLSDSFDNLGGYSSDIASGDLPAEVTILDDSTIGGSDEGRAMAQIIHDIAPGSELLFHTAFTGIANFAQGIIDLANAGADIIVDDVFYFAEPMFQDGVIAQAVDTVTQGGTLYFSSAGNSSDKSYESSFVDSGISIGVTKLHDFDPGAGVDTGFGFTLAAGERLTIVLQWDQPFFSVSGGTGSQSDVDIFLVQQGTQNILASAVDDNIGGDPVEVLSFTNNSISNLLVDFGIGLFSGAAPGLMKFVIIRGNPTALEYSLASSTTYGHSNAEGALAVGAAAYFDTPEFGSSPPLAENFTSLGGTPILFDVAGNRLTTPIIRDNVDFTAPDGGNTTFFGSDVEPDGFPNFFGTSASAPAAAAVAALLLDVAPTATIAQIETVLEATAIDMGVLGYDFLTGAGLIQANAALFELLDITDNIIIGDSLDNVFDGRGGVDRILGKDGSDTLYGGKGDDQLIGGNGRDVLFGGDDNDRLLGGAGDDELVGGDGSDVLIGGGSGDADLLRGGLGDDTYVVQDSADTVFEFTDEGIDTVRSGIGYILPANVENLGIAGGAISATGNTLDNRIAGSGRSNILLGLEGADIIRGGNAADTIDGGVGDDLIDGGQGKDLMTGDDGADRFQFRFASDFNATRNTADIITDFDQAEGDVIQLNAIDANTNTGTNDSFEWIATKAFSGTAGEMRYEQVVGDTFIEGDTDGDGQADLMIRLIGLHTLDANDVIGVSDLQPNLDPASPAPLFKYTELFSDSGLLSADVAGMDGEWVTEPDRSLGGAMFPLADPSVSRLSAVSMTANSGDDMLSYAFSPEGLAGFAVAPAAAFDGEGSSPRLGPAALFDAPMPEAISLYVDNVI